MKLHLFQSRAVVLVGVLLLTCVVEAHVRVTPQQSAAGATETYSARVPTEGKVTTTSVVLDVPEGVTIVSVADVAGTSHEMKRDTNRVTQVIWTTAIKPGDVSQLGFVARNPTSGAEIIWKFHQRYEDGTSSEWVGAAGTKAPAPVTKLAP